MSTPQEKFTHSLAELIRIKQPNCVNCDHWHLEAERCLKFNARPPATVIVVGCDKWVAPIPF